MPIESCCLPKLGAQGRCFYTRYVHVCTYPTTIARRPRCCFPGLCCLANMGPSGRVLYPSIGSLPCEEQLSGTFCLFDFGCPWHVSSAARVGRACVHGFSLMVACQSIWLLCCLTFFVFFFRTASNAEAHQIGYEHTGQFAGCRRENVRGGHARLADPQLYFRRRIKYGTCAAAGLTGCPDKTSLPGLSSLLSSRQLLHVRVYRVV